ncbi:MAG: peptide deformylase [Acidiferrobacteraceae bacterium]|nr:peptide deformylase [Acidiferrobacteraceae bacterium]|tara:strand:- start:142 stop:594 length:453 start_codon:yes stop_codon:yes gene_type:complete
MKMITEVRRLQRRCKSVGNEEGYNIGKKLLRELSLHKDGVGLAANQVGINKRVCVINVSKPIVLINPEIIEASGRVIYEEACLSLPGQVVNTERYRNITVVASNYREPLYFGGEDMLECVCVQHEIDHLNGKTMLDRRTKRNDIMGSAYL